MSASTHPGQANAAHSGPAAVANRTSLASRRLAFDEIPVIDLAPLFGPRRRATEDCAAGLLRACTEVGFFYIRNHRIAARTIETALEQTRRFFALPMDAKLAYDLERTRRHRGYVPFSALSADPGAEPDRQEGFEVGLELPADDPLHLAGNSLHGPNVWPDELPGFSVAVYRYFEELLALGHVLFRAFAISLGLREDFFEPMITRPITQLRLIHYPETEHEAGDSATLGVGAHTDYECFTILWQDAPGLQVQNTSGEWIEAVPIPGTFVVNIGDMMQRWTNDLFVSTPHRVVNPARTARYSLPMFFGTNHDTVVRVLPECTGPGNPPRYPPTHAGHWTETMHTHVYAYREAERGTIPNPELA